jgi:hypothetical protein
MANDSISLDDLKAKVEAAEAEFLRAEEGVRRAEEVVRRADAQRERFRNALQVCEEMLAGAELETSSTTPPPAPIRVASRPIRAKTNPPTVAERAIATLEAAGKFLSTQELLDSMQRDGYKATSKSRPYDSVYGSLHHDARRERSRLVNKDAKWGLKEWTSEGSVP